MENINFRQWLVLYLLAGVVIMVLGGLFLKFIAWFANRPTIRDRAPESSRDLVDSASEIRKILSEPLAPIAMAVIVTIWPVILCLCVYRFLKKEDSKKPVV